MDKQYWENRYSNQETGWDTGGATTPIVAYFEQIQDLNARILIPGCGNAHEAEHLHARGFRNVYVCDWAQQPLQALQARVPDFPAEHLLCGDFFEIQEKDFDYIVEQTFFCALPPSMRADYIAKAAQLLVKGGKMVGLLFKFPLTEQGPPFGGSEEEYRGYFSQHFSTFSIQDCHNSIKPRLGNEFWIELVKG